MDLSRERKLPLDPMATGPRSEPESGVSRQISNSERPMRRCLYQKWEKFWPRALRGSLPGDMRREEAGISSLRNGRLHPANPLQRKSKIGLPADGIFTLY